jgi:hypothetical protein
LWEKAIPDMDKMNPAAAELIRLIIERIRSVPDRYGFVDEPEEGNEEDTFESQEVPDKLSGIIGRVSITQKTPATPYEFYFWLKTDERMLSKIPHQDVPPADKGTNPLECLTLSHTPSTNTGLN